MNTVCLSLGSNLGNRIFNLQTALTFLNYWVSVQTISDVYVSTGLKMQDKQAPDFFNIACIAKTMLAETALLNIINGIEANFGRFRMPPTTDDKKELSPSRTIDIDIIFIDNKVIHNKHLDIPHPEYKNRDFVLYPLANILEAHWKDPVNQNSLNQIISHFEANPNKYKNLVGSFSHEFNTRISKNH